MARFFSVAQKYVVFSIVANVFLVGVRMSPAAVKSLDMPLVLGITTLVVGTVFIISVLTIWVLVGYVATKSGGWLYGFMHLLLVVVLTPLCLVGLFAIPSLVMGDLMRWHDWEEAQRK